LRIVLDTNVLLAAFGTRGLCESLLAACLDGHDLATSEHILLELGRNLVRKFRLPARRSAEVVAFIREQAEVIEPAPVPSGACSDPDDLPVLGTAVAGRADVLVTGEADLLSLGSYSGIAVITPRECYRRLV
jgi:putative PIN family toxin of toxin-antitoxin system